MRRALLPTVSALARGALLAVALAGLAGCASASTEIARPEDYPDRGTPEACWSSFVWAWRTGDVPTLEQTYGLWKREELLQQIEAQGREKVASWYRSEADRLVIAEARWDRRSELLAYLTARLGRRGERPHEVRFAFMKRDDGWCITAERVQR